MKRVLIFFKARFFTGDAKFMNFEFFRRSDYAHSHEFIFKKAVKIILVIVLLETVLWTFALKKPIYQYLYGKPYSNDLTIYERDIFENLPIRPSPIVLKSSNFSVRLTFLKFYRSTAKVVYVDRYNFIGTWYRGNRFSYIYDKIAPLDISTVSGKTARPDILKHFDFSHEYRLLWFESKKRNELFIRDDINNNHIIPANKNIAKALEILKKRDIAHMEGYLVHVNGLDSDKNFELKSALSSGEISHQKAGGQTTGLCRVIYLTKIAFDGYIFE